MWLYNMAFILPASLQELVGRRISRISTSYPLRDVIIFDTSATRENARTRYAYYINGTFDKVINLSTVVGYNVLSIEALDQEATGQYKLLVRTSGSYGFGVLFFSLINSVGILMEDGASWEQEEDGDCACILTETDGITDLEFSDLPIDRAPPYSGTTQYVVQEDDVNYDIGALACPCDQG